MRGLRRLPSGVTHRGPGRAGAGTGACFRVQAAERRGERRWVPVSLSREGPFGGAGPTRREGRRTGLARARGGRAGGARGLPASSPQPRPTGPSPGCTAAVPAWRRRGRAAAPARGTGPWGDCAEPKCWCLRGLSVTREVVAPRDTCGEPSRLRVGTERETDRRPRPLVHVKHRDTCRVL